MSGDQLGFSGWLLAVWLYQAVGFGKCWDAGELKAVVDQFGVLAADLRRGDDPAALHSFTVMRHELQRILAQAGLDGLADPAVWGTETDRQRCRDTRPRYLGELSEWGHF